jgi:DNA-binding CsgD family transcriptional regulator
MAYMHTVARADVAAALDFVASLGSASVSQDIVRGIGDVIPCDVASLNVIDARTSRITFVDWPHGTCGPTHLDAWGRHAQDHPLTHVAYGVEQPSIVHLPQLAFRSTALFAEFYAVLGLRGELAAVTALSAHELLVVALDRAHPTFTARDQLLFELLAPHLIRAYRAASAPAVGALTSRETEILRCVAAGATNRDVATHLAISPRTVQKHLEHAYRKLGVATRTAAADVLRRHAPA